MFHILQNNSENWNGSPMKCCRIQEQQNRLDFWLIQRACTETVLGAAAAAKSLQSCPTLCDPIDGSPLGSPVSGILQARTLEWVAISFSNAWKWNRSVVPDLATLWTAAYQAPPSMGFSRQEYWSGCKNQKNTDTYGNFALESVCSGFY